MLKKYSVCLALLLCFNAANLLAESAVSKSDYIDTVFKMSSPAELCAAFVEQGFVEEKGCVNKLSSVDKQCRNKVSDMFPGDKITGDGNELLGQILLCRVSLLKGLDFPVREK